MQHQLGTDVVPEVKYSSIASSGAVVTAGAGVVEASESEYDSQPDAGSPTAMRVKSPSTDVNAPVTAEAAITCLTSPRSTRSRRSAEVSSIVAGIVTAPRRMQASMHSHNSTWLPSMSRTRSPWCTPASDNQPATCSERAERSA